MRRRPFDGCRRSVVAGVSRVLAAAFVLFASLIIGSAARVGDVVTAPLPERLQDTGLYSDWSTRTIDPAHLSFSPQYPLWTDGAAKSRWLHLPAGSFIDASDPDAWEFPVGTKVWKEFRFHDAPAETRYIERTSEGWRYASYVWKADGSATLVPARGILNSVEIRDGVRHAIPSRSDCTACHEASPSRLLGLGTLQLSADRDPLAPHAEPLPAGAVDVPTLVARGLVRGLPATLIERPARIAAPTPIARAALGYLHGNCGMCHTGGGEMASLGFVLQASVATAESAVPASVRTTFAQASHFQSAQHPSIRDRILPGHPDASMLVARMASRHPVLQMPPLGSRLVDAEAVALLRRWIAEPPQLVTSTR
jgi:hypothetical protein